MATKFVTVSLYSSRTRQLPSKHALCKPRYLEQAAKRNIIGVKPSNPLADYSPHPLFSFPF